MTAVAKVAAPERVICGTFHPDLDMHRRCMVLAGYAQEDADSYDDTGCGRSILWTFAYRCVECGRWFHRDCIRRHFAKAAEAPY